MVATSLSVDAVDILLSLWQHGDENMKEEVLTVLHNLCFHQPIKSLLVDKGKRSLTHAPTYPSPHTHTYPSPTHPLTPPPTHTPTPPPTPTYPSPTPTYPSPHTHLPLPPHTPTPPPHTHLPLPPHTHLPLPPHPPTPPPTHSYPSPHTCGTSTALLFGVDPFLKVFEVSIASDNERSNKMAASSVLALAHNCSKVSQQTLED